MSLIKNLEVLKTKNKIIYFCFDRTTILYLTNMFIMKIKFELILIRLFIKLYIIFIKGRLLKKIISSRKVLARRFPR